MLLSELLENIKVDLNPKQNVSNNISYTGIILKDGEKERVVQSLYDNNVVVKESFEKDWKIICHHMTINLGPLKKDLNENLANGDEAEVSVTDWGVLKEEIDGAEYPSLIAVKVKNDTINSQNETKHITVAIKNGSKYKPKDSNNIKEWTPFPIPFKLTGNVQEIANK